MFLEQLPAEIRQKILGHLNKVADVVNASITCKLLRADADPFLPRDFYFPSYAKFNIDTARSNNKIARYIWNQIPGEEMYKEFYPSTAALFENDERAKGCYKVSVSPQAFKLASAKLKTRKIGEDVIICALPLREADIKSYLDRNNQEFSNIRSKTKKLEKKEDEQMDPTPKRFGSI